MASFASSVSGKIRTCARPLIRGRLPLGQDRHRLQWAQRGTIAFGAGTRAWSEMVTGDLGD